MGLDESARVSPSSCAVQIDFCALAGLGARDFESEGGAAFAPSERANKSNRPISPRSPWQNPYIERLIGTLWRDCLDHVLILGEMAFTTGPDLYSLYYNDGWRFGYTQARTFSLETVALEIRRVEDIAPAFDALKGRLE